MKFDIWPEKHLKLMDKGGNDALHAFFELYNLNSESIETKYKSRAAQWYRKKLAAEAEDD